MKNQCQICGSFDTQLITQTEIFEYKGQEIPIPNYTFLHCNMCGEGVADKKSVEMSALILEEAHRKINKLEEK